MKALRKTFFARALGRLADAVVRRPHWFIWPQLALVALSITYTVTHLKFDTDRNDLVGADKKYHQNYLKFKKEFPLEDDLVVMVESDSPEKNRQVVERLGAKLEAETNLFTDVFFKGDLKMLGKKALQFVPEKDLAEMGRLLADYRPFIEEFTQTTNLVSFFGAVNTQFRTAKAEENAQTKSLIKALPALERIVGEAADCLPRAGVPPSPGVTALFGAGEAAAEEIYITFAQGQIYLVTAHARSGDLNEAAVQRLRELIEETRTEVSGVNIGLTGEPVLEIDEMRQSERDTLLASVVSFVLVFVIIIFGYGKVSRRIKADGCLLVGMGYAMAFTTFAVGHLNILTITFAPILIGIAIDFGVHLIARYEEELQNGAAPKAALRTAMVLTGQGIFTGALTTAGAFLAMAITEFKGIQEMGIISGGGLLVSLVPMLTMLPALLLLERRSGESPKPSAGRSRRERVEQIWLRRPGLVVGFTLAACAVAVTQFPKVAFDYNLLNMQSQGLPAVVVERKLIDSSQKSVLFAAVVADTAAEAAALERVLTNLPVVADVKSMSQFLTEDQTRKLELIGEIKATAAGLAFPEIDGGPAQVVELSRTLWSFQGYLGLAAEAAKEDAGIQRQLLSLRARVVELRKRMLGLPAAAVEAKLGAFQRGLFRDIQETFLAIRDQDNRQAMRAEDLPPALKNRFVGRTGKYMLQVFPKKDVWQRENQKEFVQVLRRTLDPQGTNHPIITGTPIQLYEYTTLLKESYQKAAWYSLAAIVFLVLVHFRNLNSVVLALVPVAIGGVWLGGFMGLFHIPFNPANIMTLPLVIGIGVTNGIHILNRFAEERAPSILAKSTGKAVLVSGLTTIAGFGSLVLAKHQGIQSLGYVMAVGVATCMIAGLTLLPAILNLQSQRKEESKKKTQR